ncbi:MAG: hypothetical protein KDD34_02715 [Bdellovibrionales bacterium]|nr:hypothetical protein [Bdellovibrionales bacterium]
MKAQILTTITALLFTSLISVAQASQLDQQAPMTSESWSDVLEYVDQTNSWWTPSPHVAPKAQARKSSEFTAVKQLDLLNEALKGSQVLRPGVITIFRCDHPACTGQ